MIDVSLLTGDLRGINFISVLVGIYLLYHVREMVQRKIDNVPQLLTLIGVGVALIVVGLVPESIDLLLSVLGMTSRAYAVFTTAILFLLVIIVHLLSRIRRLETELSKLNSEIALSLAEDGGDEIKDG